MNPDAVFGQPLGAAPILPTKLITRMNDPGQPPQRERVAKALKELQQAAASIPAGCNDHNLGHLGLVVSDAEYTTKSNGRPHVPPANPGPSPTIPAVANLDQRDRAIRGCYIEKGHYNLCEQVNTALKNLLLDSIDAVYINHLEDDMLGFQPVTIRQIIDSITDRYLKFNETQKEELEKQLEKQHDGGPIDTHIAIFNKVFKAFETAGEPFTNKQKVSKFYRSVRRFSLAKKACEDWDDRPEAERTWANMQSDLRDWYDKKMANTTTEAAGYHGANLASSASDDPFLSRADLLLADTTEALKTNQAMMANLAKKSNEKDDAIAKLRQEIASLKAENRVLREGRNHTGGSGGYRGGGQQNGAGHFPGQGPNLNRQEKRELQSILPRGHYCHTCGYSSNHPSFECTCKGPNHVDNATKFNPCGGSSRRN